MIGPQERKGTRRCEPMNLLIYRAPLLPDTPVNAHKAGALNSVSPRSACHAYETACCARARDVATLF